MLHGFERWWGFEGGEAVRHKNVNWDLKESLQVDGASLAVLMDIRDLLKSIDARLLDVKMSVSLLHCHETLAIPRILRGIQRNTAKPREKKI